MPQTKCNDVFNALALKSFYLKKFVDERKRKTRKKFCLMEIFWLRNKSDYQKILILSMRQKEFSMSFVINVETKTFLKSSLTS